jgi:hypothetical protein
MYRLPALLCLSAGALAAQAPVNVVLWFDTEDYIEPSADDAALRLARELSSRGIRATFKLVGEKARVLEARRRTDVIGALSRHDIGYHAETHSQQPAPAVYLRDLDWFEGAAEFERREGRGVRDIRRIFGVTPSCYGQPGSSWGPQSYPALLRLGIPVYLDEGSHAGLNEQPFWFGGMFHVYAMGRYVLRASLRPGDPLSDAIRKFDSDAEELRRAGGGLISIYYHPTEFVATEFWDAVNFPRGASRAKEEWVKPRLRTREDSERVFKVFFDFIDHARAVPGVKFVTARDFARLYQPQLGRPVSREAAARHLSQQITYLETPESVLSAAELLQILLGLTPQVIEGPAARLASTYADPAIPRWLFDRARADGASYITAHRRIPSQFWIGSAALSPADFAATLAADSGSGDVTVRRGTVAAEKYIATDSTRTFDWAIHPAGFSAPHLHELARLQAWTLKPARLRK